VGPLPAQGCHHGTGDGRSQIPVESPKKGVVSMPEEEKEPKEEKVVVEVREIEKLEPTGRSPGMPGQ